ncbi:MAG: hypothetical protein Q4G04_06760 [bacterium]|nr:hypothetical protein [bacterium]
MGKSKFNVKDVENDNIIIEEDRESKRKKSLFLLFLSKYGRIVRVGMLSLSFTTFVVAGGITLSTIEQRSKQIYQVDVPAGMILEFTNLTSQVNIGSNELLQPIYQEDSDQLEPHQFTISNTSSAAKVNYRVRLKEFDDYSLANDECVEEGIVKKLSTLYLRYSVYINNVLKYNQLLSDTARVSSNVNDNYIVASGSLDPGETDSIKYRMWLDESATNNEMDKHYHGTLIVEYEEVQ